MTLGPGKYDAICTQARNKTQAKDGIILIVLGGKHGDGFSMQATLEVTVRLPEFLRELATKIEQDAQRLRSEVQ